MEQHHPEPQVLRQHHRGCVYVYSSRGNLQSLSVSVTFCPQMNSTQIAFVVFSEQQTQEETQACSAGLGWHHNEGNYHQGLLMMHK